MNATKNRFEKVPLKEVKKIFPELAVDGNENHRGKKKDGRAVAKTSKAKSKA